MVRNLVIGANPMNAEVGRPAGCDGPRPHSRQSGRPSEDCRANLRPGHGRRKPPTPTTEHSSCSPSTPPSTVLEVGFGQGRTTAVLARPRPPRPRRRCLTDGMVNQATARNRAACREPDQRLSDTATASQSRSPITPRTFAFTVHTVYFMADPAATFADIARVLRPGGTLVIACRTGDTPIPSWIDPDERHPPRTRGRRLAVEHRGDAHSPPPPPSRACRHRPPLTEPASPRREQPWIRPRLHGRSG